MKRKKKLVIALILQGIMLALPIPSKAQTKPTQILTEHSANHSWHSTGNLISMPFTMKSGWEFSWGSEGNFTTQLFRKDVETNLYVPFEILADHHKERGLSVIKESGLFFIVIQSNTEWHARVNPLVD